MRSFNETQIMTKEKFRPVFRVYRKQPGSKGTRINAGNVSLQLGQRRAVGPHAYASCEDVRPGPKCEVSIGCCPFDQEL